jgi:hypothetical protein
MKRLAARSAALAVLIVPAPVDAHSADAVSRAAYLTLAPGVVRLELEISAGTAAAAALVRAIDRNRDGRLSRAEADAFGAHQLAATRLMLDGKRTAWRLQQVTLPQARALALGAGDIVITALAARPDRVPGGSLSYASGCHDAHDRCASNVFAENAQGWRYRIERQVRSDHGQSIGVRYAATRR